MTILFVGNEDIDFIGPTKATQNFSSSHDSAYTRGGLMAMSILFANRLRPASGPFTPQSEVWLRFCGHIATRSSGGKGVAFALENAALGTLVQINSYYDQDTQTISWNNGSGVMTETETYTMLGWSVNVATYYDLHVKITGTTMLMEVFSGEALVFTKTVTLASTYLIDNFGLGAGGGSFASWGIEFSQVIAATEPTLGWHVFTRAPTANGFYTDFAGDYTAVNTLVMGDNSIATEVAARESFNRATLTVGAGREVKAVVVRALARTGEPSLTNGRVFLRSGSTDYESASKTIGTGFTLLEHMWTTDPATGAKFTNTKVEANLEYGVRALT